MSGRVILAFIFGAAAGSVGTYFAVKDFFEKEYEAEIEENRAYYEEKINGIKDAVEGLESPKNGQKRASEELEEDKTDYQEIIKTLNYNTVAKKPENKEDEKTPKVDKRYISYNEYVENNGHEQMELEYYEGDDTLINDQEEIVDNRDYLLPSDWNMMFNQPIFDDGPDDIVCVRNNVAGVDILINLHEDASWSEITGDAY